MGMDIGMDVGRNMGMDTERTWGWAWSGYRDGWGMDMEWT